MFWKFPALNPQPVTSEEFLNIHQTFKRSPPSTRSLLVVTRSNGFRTLIRTKTSTKLPRSTLNYGRVNRFEFEYCFDNVEGRQETGRRNAGSPKDVPGSVPVLQVLEIPPPRPPIRTVCKRGHNVCGNCFTALGKSHCPVSPECQRISEDIQDVAVETMMKSLKLPMSCKNHAAGCDFSGSLEDVITQAGGRLPLSERAVRCTLMLPRHQFQRLGRPHGP